MSEKDKNLTPWQEKNLEYRRKKAEEARQEAKKNQPKIARFSSPFLKTVSKKEEAKSGKDISEETENVEGQETILSELENIAQDVESLRRTRPSIFAGSGVLLKKMWIGLAFALLIFFGSVYAVSPLSKIGNFTVSGNQNESAEQIALASKIKTGDSIFQILNTKQNIENTIKAQFPRVSTVKLSYHFPNNFEAQIQEYANSVYAKQSNKTYLVLSNGYIITTPVDSKQVQENKLPTLQNFSNAEVQEFVKAYETLKPALKALITNVTKTPTSASKDFIALDMSDGNQVRVPLSQLAEKLPYYPSVAKQVKAPQVVDMEAGIYTKPKAAYLADLSKQASAHSSSLAAEKAKKAAENTGTSASSTTTSN